VLRALESVSPLLEQRRHRVDIDVSPDGLAVDVDPDRLAQVVTNLLTNAAKYSDAGTTIRALAERSGGRVRLRVRDEGIGISPAMKGRIFDIFFQQPQALDRAKGGLGLGLAIVRSLVELHGGSVALESEGIGKGSEFVVELPVARGAEEVALAPAASSPPPSDDTAPRLRNSRVLVVDDNDDAAETTADVLRDLGYEVVTAHDGSHALHVAATFRPNICLLDIGLPEMDGYELAHLLLESRHLAEGGRLIAVTGYGQVSDRERSLRAGFSAHVVKPVSLDVLQRLLEASPHS
jgi:CheY-like chemotaxis protein